MTKKINTPCGAVSAFCGYQEILPEAIERFFEDESEPGNVLNKAENLVQNAITKYDLTIKTRPISISKQLEDQENLVEAMRDVFNRLYPDSIPDFVKEGLNRDYTPLVEHGGKNKPTDEIRNLLLRLNYMTHQIESIKPPSQVTTNPGKEPLNKLIIDLAEIYIQMTEPPLNKEDKTSYQKDKESFISEIISIFKIKSPKNIKRKIQSELKKSS